MLTSGPSASVVVVSLLLLATSCQRNNEAELWLVLAREYVKADATLLQNEADKKNTAAQDYAARKEAEAKLLRAEAPRNSVLQQLLRSGDAETKKLALVNIMLRKIDDNVLLGSILEKYRIDDDMFTKFYSIQCFKDLNQNKLKVFEDSLINILDSETNEIPIIAAMPTLAKLDKSKVELLFSRYAKTGSQGLRDIAVLYLKGTSHE